nr:hypothetical protein [Candidatus Sigynarchaeum springense]
MPTLGVPRGDHASARKTWEKVHAEFRKIHDQKRAERLTESGTS